MKRLLTATLITVIAFASIACATKFITVTGGPPGATASVAVKTTASAYCSISYVTPAGTTSTAQGLESKYADTSGAVSWSWNIGANTTRGDGTVTVTCNRNQTIRSAIHIG